MRMTIRLEMLAAIGVALAVSLFAAWYFSTEQQFRRAINQSASWCKTAEEQARVKDLARYALPEERRLKIAIIRTLDRTGNKTCPAV